MIIDSHQHFWTYSPVTHQWIEDHMMELRRDFLPEDLSPIFREHRIHGCVAVQADSSMEETRFLLELAARHTWILGVVGWIDLQAIDISAQLEALHAHSQLKGFRHIVQSEPDPMFVMQPDVLRGIKAIGQAGYSFDLLVYPHQLPAVLELLEACPDQTFILDHLAKPYIQNGWLKGWETMIRAIAGHPQVYLKISGLVTEANWHSWTPDDFRPYLDVISDSFSPSRVMFGSDWPVCRLAAPYQEVLSIAKTYVATLPDTMQAGFWWKNAKTAYNLET